MTDTEPEKTGNVAASEFLKDIKGKQVIVKVAPGIEYHGIMQAVDGFMNITLKQTKEVYDDQTVAEYGDIFIRGSLVTYISAV